MKILLVYDVENWAWFHRAKAIQKYLPSFDINIISQSDFKDVDVTKYDHVHNFDIEDNRLRNKTSTGIYSYGHLKTMDTSIERMTQYQALITVNQDLYNWARTNNINKQIYYIRNGIDLSLFYNKPELKNPDKFVVGFSAKKTPPHLDLKGYTTIWQPLMARLSKYDHIEFLEHSSHYYDGVKHDQMINVFNKMDILVCPSHSEGCLGSLLEAMACEIPVMATSTGVVPELTSEGVLKAPKYELENQKQINGIIDLMESKILELSYNKDKCYLMGMQNRKEIEKDWAWEITIKKWKTFFELMKNTSPNYTTSYGRAKHNRGVSTRN